MPFMVSPGVEVQEIDLTNVVPAVSTSIGAYAGGFRWGPVNEVVRIGSERDLVNNFFEPDDVTFKYFMPAAQFLQYSNDLRVVRAEQDGMLNADQASGTLIRNEDDYVTTTFTAANHFIAKHPGALGNSLKVWVVSNFHSFNDPAFTSLGYDALFNNAPGTSDYAAQRGVEDDEIHIVIVDEDGLITGTPGEVLEIWEGLSQASDARANNGATNYYVSVLNDRSKYIWVASPDPLLPEAGIKTTDTTNLQVATDGFEYTTSNTALTYDFDNGSDGTTEDPTVGELQLAYDLFDDSETLDINFIIGAPTAELDDITLANYLIAIAEGRKDAVAFVSPSISRTVNNSTATTDVKDWADSITSSSYGFLDSGALYVFDKYNDVYRWIVASGDIAGLCAFTDETTDPWFSPAGFNRGQLRGVTKLAFNPRKNDRDTLYKARVNPIASFPGQGIVLYGDKTALAKPSAFDRINVRRLFITLEKAIATAARFQLFEINDEFTRAQFRNLVEPFLRDVQGRRGMTDFQVVCDDTNNTGEVIDSNRFVCDIYIQPARSINFITLNFVAVRTGVEFSEIAGQ